MTPKPRSLLDLLAAAGARPGGPVSDREISQLTDDSRKVQPGALFVAVRGPGADGHRFVEQAVRRGAAAVLAEEEVETPPRVERVLVAETRSLLGPLASAFFGAPSERLRVVGVTGTKGKTTVAWLTQHLLSSTGLPCGLIGTVCHRLGDREVPAGNTTPGAVSLQEMLAEMVRKGLAACAMEVSSHALDQGRAGGIRWARGVFTNIAPEHLDYHGDMENYLDAKLRLFRALPRGAGAVINRDDPSWGRVQESCSCPTATYSLGGKADLTAREVRLSLEGTAFRLECREGSFAARTDLPGKHNLENVLAALGAVVTMGVPVERALAALPEFKGVPGRLERVDCGQPFPVFVDYAHTDGSLSRVLEELRALSGKKVAVVFGCGGDRDRAKRPRMGRVAADSAHRVIITSDNSRSEEPGQIAREIAEGMEGSSTPRDVILDRREAIRSALEAADEGWVVLISGKGHEGTQLSAGKVVPFDDRAVAKELLERRRAARGIEV